MVFALLYISSAYFVAELLTGIIHWLEDRYGNPDWPIIGPHVIAPNVYHHKSPFAFCRVLLDSELDLAGACPPDCCHRLCVQPLLGGPRCYLRQSG